MSLVLTYVSGQDSEFNTSSLTFQPGGATLFYFRLTLFMTLFLSLYFFLILCNVSSSCMLLSTSVGLFWSFFLG